MEFCAYLGDAPAQAALEGALPAGRFVPWDRWAKALPYEYWLALFAYRYDQQLESGARLHETTRQALEANRAWIRNTTGPPPSVEKDPLRALWRWHQEGGDSPARGSWLHTEAHPLGWDFDPRVLADEGLQLLLQRPLHPASQDPDARAEVAFLTARLGAKNLTPVNLRAAAEAGHEAASIVAVRAPLALPEWLAALRGRSGSWRHQETSHAPFLSACYHLLAEAGNQLQARSPEELESDSRHLYQALARSGWLRGEPAGRARIQGCRIGLLHSLEEHDEPPEGEWLRLSAELLDATRAISNRDALELERRVLALRDLLEPERGDAAEQSARDHEVRLNLQFPDPAKRGWPGRESS